MIEKIYSKTLDGKNKLEAELEELKTVKEKKLFGE